MKDKSNLIIQGVILVGAIFFVRLAAIDKAYLIWFLIHFVVPFAVLSTIGIRITINTMNDYDYFFRLGIFMFVVGMAIKFFTTWRIEIVPMSGAMLLMIISGYLWLRTFGIKVAIDKIIGMIMTISQKTKQ